MADASGRAREALRPVFGPPALVHRTQPAAAARAQAARPGLPACFGSDRRFACMEFGCPFMARCRDLVADWLR